MTDQKSAKELGKWGEETAKSFLEERGYEVIYQNVYTEHGEIDLVALKENCTHFVEVKTRRTKNYGHPEDAITQYKLNHMINSANAFLLEHPELDGDWQIDVIAIQTGKRKDSLEIKMFKNVQ